MRLLWEADFLKRNNFSRSLILVHTRYHQRSGLEEFLINAHLIVSGSISFRWFVDDWKMLLLFMLFSLLHNRIVDIFIRSKFTILLFSPCLFMLSLQDYIPQYIWYIKSQCFASLTLDNSLFLHQITHGFRAVLSFNAVLRCSPSEVRLRLNLMLDVDKNRRDRNISLFVPWVVDVLVDNVARLLWLVSCNTSWWK